MLNFFNLYFTNVINGTINRKEYWIFILWSIGYGIVIGITYEIFGNPQTEEDAINNLIIMMIPLIWPSIISMVKRIRDIGISGWWYSLTTLPYIGSIIGFIFAILPTNYFRR